MDKAGAPQKKIKPRALAADDRIGIVAPASPIDRDLFEAGCATLRRMGYEPVYSQSIFDRELFCAGTVERRARELEEMLGRHDVNAILCARGGYGSAYLLPRFDFGLLRRHPKIFIGYSDLTSLLTFFCDRGLVCFHGPMLAKDFACDGGVDIASWQAALAGGAQWPVNTAGMAPIIEGIATGELYGGCLSLLCASLGTPYEFSAAGKILFLEDVRTKPYQIDRMLLQLRLAGKLQRVRGIVFGEMPDCAQPGAEYSLAEVLRRAIGDLAIPVALGLRSGHVSRANITLPFGVRARLEVGGEVKLTILETAVSPRKSAKAVSARAK